MWSSGVDQSLRQCCEPQHWVGKPDDEGRESQVHRWEADSAFIALSPRRGVKPYAYVLVLTVLGRAWNMRKHC